MACSWETNQTVYEATVTMIRTTQVRDHTTAGAGFMSRESLQGHLFEPHPCCATLRQPFGNGAGMDL